MAAASSVPVQAEYLNSDHSAAVVVKTEFMEPSGVSSLKTDYLSNNSDHSINYKTEYHAETTRLTFNGAFFCLLIDRAIGTREMRSLFNVALCWNTMLEEYYSCKVFRSLHLYYSLFFSLKRFPMVQTCAINNSYE